MKHMKKYFALAVALIMALALAAPAWATSTGGSTKSGTEGTITISNYDKIKDENKAYTAYKISTSLMRTASIPTASRLRRPSTTC